MPIYDKDDEHIAVKKVKDERKLTKEQQDEWLKCANDKYYWMQNYVWVTSPEGKVLFEARPYQKRIIALTEQHRFAIIMSGRQSGKSTTLAVDIMHDLVFRRDYHIGFTSYTQTNTDDIRERVGEIYEDLPTWMKPPVRLYNQKYIKFATNASLQFQVTSAKTFRGKSKHRIIIDELAHVEPKVAEAFMTALMPSITGAGTKATTRLNIISTPAGTSGMFAQYWYGAVAGTNGFGYTKVEYEEIPDRGPEFEADMLTKMSKNKFNQEYRCVGGDTIVTIDGVEMTIEELHHIFSQRTHTSVLAPDSTYRTFCGVGTSNHSSYYVVRLENGTSLKCSTNHRFMTILGWLEASEIRVGDLLGDIAVETIELKEEPIVLYDLIDVDGHAYLTNGVPSHNCHMISDKGTLINSQMLEAIQTKDPVKQFFDMDIYVDDVSGRKLMMSCDVSEGIGQDSHAIQVFDIDTLEQVAEFQNNTASQTTYTKDIIRFITYFFKSGAEEIYYGVENNGVGAGVLRLLENSNDPYLAQAYMISTNGAEVKTGLVTSAKTKAEACQYFKDLVEREKLVIHSAKLKTQLQFFVKQGTTFKAERGMHDDLPMACIVMMNLLKELANFEDTASDHMTEIDDNHDEEDWGIYF